MITVITIGGQSVNLVSIVRKIYTDLVIGATDTQVSSAGNPFGSADVGATLMVTGGTGFTAGGYVVLSVAGGVATLDRAVGTAGSTAGTGTLNGGPSPRQVQFEMQDAVASSASVFTGQTQVQQWAGADIWRGTITFPPMGQADADNLIAFMMELRGMANGFMLGDPMKAAPRGTGGTGTATAAAAGSQTLSTSFGAGALLPGDYMQIGYRLYRALEATDGSSAIGIWPSIREPLAGGEAITTLNTQGLFRLGSNKRGWSADYTKLSAVSFQIQEWR